MSESNRGDTPELTLEDALGMVKARDEEIVGLRAELREAKAENKVIDEELE